MSTKAPLPPGDIATRPLTAASLAKGTRLYRIHRNEHDPLYFGRTGSGRFDDAAGQFGVCYFGQSRFAAFAETFLRSPGATLIDWSEFAARSITVLAASRRLCVAPMHGPGLAKLGATAAVTHGPHKLAQAWSSSLFAHPKAFDGVVYRARHDDDELCLAMFERDQVPLKPIATTALVSDESALSELLDRYGVGLSGYPE